MFNVYNDDRKLVINDSYKNFFLKRKVRIEDFDVKKNTDTKYHYELTLQPGEVFAAADVILKHGTVIPYQLTDSKVIVDGLRVPELLSDAELEGYYIYLFGTDPIRSERGAGMEVYGANGHLLFSSDSKPLNVIHCFTKNDEVYPLNGIEKTRKLAYVGVEKEYTVTLKKYIENLPVNPSYSTSLTYDNKTIGVPCIRVVSTCMVLFNINLGDDDGIVGTALLIDVTGY